MNSKWPLIKLGNVLTPVSRAELIDPGKEYRLLGVRLDGQGPFLRETVSGSKTAAAKLYRVKAGDFIYSRLFAWRGAFGIIGKELDGGYVSGEFPTFLTDSSQLDSSFLRSWFQLPGTLARVNDNCTGSTPLTRNRFKEEFFLALQIPLPPLAEQQQIAARLEELSAMIGKARNLCLEAIEEAKALELNVTRDIFPKTSGSTVGDWVRFQVGYTFKSEWFTEEGIRLARNANISHGILDWSETVRLPESLRQQFPSFELRAGDILISLDRPIISTGIKVARVREEDLPCLLLQRVARAVFLTDAVLPEYFFAWLRSPHFADSIDPGRSNGVPHISHKDIEKIVFSAPPIPEQRRIINKSEALLAEVGKLKTLQSETATEINALLPSILDRAFNGEL